MAIEVAKGVFADFKEGKVEVSAADGGVKLTIDAGILLKPKLADVRAKIESGEIDLIPGTDLDKHALLMVTDALLKEIEK